MKILSKCMFGGFVAGLCGMFFLGGAVSATPAQRHLPEPLVKAAKRWKVQTQNVSIAVLPVARNLQTKNQEGLVPLHFGWREDVRHEPASTAKVLTTLVAIEELSARQRWYTSFFWKKDAQVDRQGIMKSPLYIRGGGDTSLVIEDFALLLDRLAQTGVKHIQGDIVVDRSLFAIAQESRNAFDGRGSRPYNLTPDPALINYRNLSFELIPRPEKNRVRVIALPKMAGVQIPRFMKLQKKGRCGDWKSAIGYKIVSQKNGKKVVRFQGSLPLSCGAKTFNVISFSANEYLERVFRAYWQKDGRSWTGKVVDGRVPDGAEKIYTHASAPIADMIRLTNKWSNNVMARHLFLSLGLPRYLKRKEEIQNKQKQGIPVASQVKGLTLDESRAVLDTWLRQHQIDSKKIWLDNGSGLSRSALVTARTMAQVLLAGANSPYASEFMSSLPVTGEDGTMYKRKIASSWGRIKTGFLSDVRSIAGYVRAKDGKLYVVYASVVGRKNMPGGIAFLDNVLLWVYNGAHLD